MELLQLLEWYTNIRGDRVIFEALIRNWVTEKKREKLSKSQYLTIPLGLASFAFLILTMLNGVTNLFSREMRKMIKPVYQRFFHNLMALVTFVLGMAALYYGIEKRTIRSYATEEICLILKIFLCITIVTSSIAALRSGYEQLKDVVSTRGGILPEKS